MEIGSEFPMKCFRYVFCLVLFFFLFLCCEKSTSPLVSGQVRLTAEEVGVTEVWLRVKTEYITGEFSLQLWRDDSCIFQSVLNRGDTTVYDSTLLPAHGYRYRARVERSGHPVLESAPLEITTMDTTSHAFQWEVYTFGTGISSVLYDVAIIDENNIWAVGEIEASGGPYNAVHWDGQQWELKRIPFIGSCSAVDYPPIRSIWAFSETNILYTNGGAIAKYNGSTFNLDCEMNSLLDGAINKMWGTDLNNIYAVGGSGTIVHYDGQRWQRMESGTELPIQDIWGAADPISGEYIILCVASEKYVVSEKKILRINPQTQQVTQFDWPFQNRRIHSLWFTISSRIWICGAGIFIHKYNVWHEFTEIPLIFTERIRGMENNDVFVAGDFGLVAHFNGIHWKIYSEAAAGLYYSCDYKAHTFVAVGQQYGPAVILRMFR